ncbi:XdhC family protein [Hominifimenecus sp. rT4P-3]|uniref:XdhC family protein n=1 Tax=Hominifimenecus sp. rT4P-3 TaxID=3242979 RepID=UPI003DA3CBCA
MDEKALLSKQLEAQEQGRGYATVTIVESDGSTPRSNGKMLVYEDGSTEGTVGGGAMERMAVKDAMEYLRVGKSALRTYDLTSPASETGMTCGGHMTVWIEAFSAKPLLVVCGAGHVGGALLPLARTVGFRTMLFDNRDLELIQDKTELADVFVPIKDYEKDLPKIDLPEGAFYVIVTFGHHFDAEALKAVLKKNGAYVGMIGSRKKVQAVYDRLKGEGVSEQVLSTVYSPIGLDIGGETPEEIAVSILAEMLMVKNGRTGKPMKQ